MLGQRRCSAKGLCGFPQMSAHQIHTTPSSETSPLRHKQVDTTSDTHKCAHTHIVFTHTCTHIGMHTRAHMHTHTHIALCSSEAVPFHVRMVGLICGESVPCWGWLGLNQSRPEQGEGKKNSWWQMRDAHWYQFVEKGRLGRWEYWGLMSWSREKNEGRKDGDGGWGPDSPCSDPAPDWFNEHTGEWPFNSKPTFSLVHTHYHQGTHMWEAWLIFCMCLQKFW